MHYREDVPSRFNLIKQFAYLPICRVKQIKPDGESSPEKDGIGSALQGSGSSLLALEEPSPCHEPELDVAVPPSSSELMSARAPQT